MKPIKLNHKELESEIGAGNTYIQVGNQKDPILTDGDIQKLLGIKNESNVETICS